MPNVRLIEDALNSLSWTIGNLQEATRLDVRTIAKALAGKPVQFAKLKVLVDAFISNKVKVRVEDYIDNPSGTPILPNSTALKVLASWDESWLTIESALEEIVIIDSFLSEFIHLGRAIEKNAHARTKNLSVSVYMASPHKKFGVQRVREKDLPNGVDVPLFPLLDRRLAQKEGDAYTANFRTYALGIRQHIGRHPKTDVSVFEYICMPSLRIIAVDHTRFYFGWFPLADQNPQHVCFYLHDKELNETDAILRDKLNAHIDRVKRLSVDVFPPGDRNKRN